jgi:hypothetical protein
VAASEVVTANYVSPASHDNPSASDSAPHNSFSTQAEASAVVDAGANADSDDSPPLATDSSVIQSNGITDLRLPAPHLSADSCISNPANDSSNTSTPDSYSTLPLAPVARITPDDVHTSKPVNHSGIAVHPAVSARGKSCRFGIRQQLDYRTFIWSYKAFSSTLPSVTQPPESSPALNPPHEDLQLEWFDGESLLPKTVHLVPLSNAAPILIRALHEEFVITSSREKLRRLASDKEMRECPRTRLFSLIVDQVHLDKPAPNRVLPYSCESAPDGVIASRVLFYQFFPSDFQLLVVSILPKSSKALDAYNNSMNEAQPAAFVSLIALVRLLRVESKKGRPVFVELLADVISIKWPNISMQERSRRLFFNHVQASSASKSGLSSSPDASTPSPVAHHSCRPPYVFPFQDNCIFM